MSTLYAASVHEAWDETPALRGLRLALPISVSSTYRTAGQYLKLRVGGHEGWFALASAPGAPAELLVKRGAAVGDALAGLSPGAALESSLALGRGFPVEENAGRDLLLLAAGSGITPIRAVVGQVAATRQRYGRVMLFYGQRRPEEFAYRAEERAWQEAGIEVVRVVSRPDGDGWSGATGHVQEALLAARPATENAVAFLCGMKPMVAGATEALIGLGLAKERIYLNY